MCGIAGIVAPDPPGELAAIARRMIARLHHRGPDGDGIHSEPGLCLGHKRLSIVDLAAGAQPMGNEDGTVWVTYNGEIFNHAGLREELLRLGHRYRSRCDTETIVHAYEEHGPACLSLFRGMFAFALWDRTHRHLFCARDRLGIKPFYYHHDGPRFAFASEIKALLECPWIRPQPRPEAFAPYLALGYLDNESTFFRGIRRLPPGHWLTFRDQKLDIQPYWRVPVPSPIRSWSFPALAAELADRVRESVRMRLMSDVPLGVFLSGGLDSTAITAIAQEVTPDPLHSFSIGYPESRYSELPFALAASQSIGTTHHALTVGAPEFLAALPSSIWHEDEPIAWPSSVSLHLVARLARQYVTVVLTGEGSDELFAGYNRHRWYGINRALSAWYRFAPGALRRLIRERCIDAGPLPPGLRRKLGHTVLGRGEAAESLLLENFYCDFAGPDLRALFADPSAAGSPYGEFAAVWAESAACDPVSRALHYDQRTYLVELLMKQDQMSMAASIESRVPFLDHPLVEFAATIPVEAKLRGSEGKRVLRHALRTLIPDAVWRRPKAGFPTPVGAWMRQEPWLGALRRLLGPRAAVARWIRPDEAARLIDAHSAGAADLTGKLWRLLNLEIWLRLFNFSGAALPPVTPESPNWNWHEDTVGQVRLSASTEPWWANS